VSGSSEDLIGEGADAARGEKSLNGGLDEVALVGGSAREDPRVGALPGGTLVTRSTDWGLGGA
jgi:hypothetical protein